MSQEYPVPGRDFGDMSVSFDTPVEQYNMVSPRPTTRRDETTA